MMASTDLVYHYTSGSALVSILKHRTIWATNILYMNDSNEMKYALDICFKFVVDRIDHRKSCRLEAGAKIDSSPDCNPDIGLEVFGFHVGRLGGFMGLGDPLPETYAFCLSTKGDDLNQWRGYSPNIGGFCIGYDLKELRRICRKKGYRIMKCKYAKRQYETQLRKLVDRVEVEGETPEGLVSKLWAIAASVKDRAFKDEDEYRLLVDGKKCDLRPHFREGASVLVPYVELPFSQEEANKVVNKVIVGPTPEPELSRRSLTAMLQHLGYHDCHVEVTSLPYRSW